MDKIIFFHMNQLGDMMFSLPVLEAARREWPDTKLASYIRKDLMPILEATGFVNQLIEKEEKGFFEKVGVISQLRKEKYSKAVLFSESPISLLLSFLSDIPERIGFKTASLKMLLTSKAEKFGVPSLSNNLKLGIKVGLKEIKENYVNLIKIPKNIIDKVEIWIQENKIEKSRLVIISPGTSKRRKEKSWQKEKWTKLINLLVDRKYCPVLIGSPSEKDQLSKLIEKNDEKVGLFTDFGILSLAGIISKAKLFIGVDSGPMHLAASLRIPVIALFGSTDPNQVGPQPLESHTVVKQSNMSEIEVDEVWQKFLEKYD
ncbi:MAG: glycosyltransferase family 9 protein [Elusimicrobia bacterium]|nr:glycosyltransferase family 9 protein [Elusimicrobiota bacterium]